MEKEYFCTRTEPSVKTKSGYVKGFRFDGIYNFYGIPYGNAKRFRMPEEPKPWEGYRDATTPGFTSPFLGHVQAIDGFPHNFWLENEDCLNLNVWTSGLADGKKRPVLVWIHGGAYVGGSSLRQPAYEGAALAKRGDVTVVSVNHRLNIFGYMDLSSFGDEYYNSGNAGIADLVLALKWIQEHIELFGGDPENITVCGQSGGGGKVTCLMQCKEARGLFHKAMILSGIFGRDHLVSNERDMHALGEAMLEALETEKTDISVLENIPTRKLIDLYHTAALQLKKKGITPVFAPKPNGYFDGVPNDGYPEFHFCEWAKDIPMVIGSTFTELNTGAKVPDKMDMAEEEALRWLKDEYGQHTEHVAKLYQRTYPDKPLIYLGWLDAWVRCKTMDYLNQRNLECRAKTYAYIFTPELPFNGGLPAWHSSDMAYLFGNCALAPVANISGVSERLEEQYSSIWLNFARTGSPSGAVKEEEWLPYTVKGQEVMEICEKSRMRPGFDTELIRYIEKNVPERLKKYYAKREKLVGI